MRELTAPEVGCFHRGVCPFCGSEELYDGPSAGTQQNVICGSCECKVNISSFVEVGGQLIRAPREELIVDRAKASELLERQMESVGLSLEPAQKKLFHRIFRRAA